MEVFIGTIQIFGFQFAPTGWALCSGQQIGIAQNQALFALLGTVYGGNGQTVFNLPNLQGRAPISQGQGLGLSPVVIGEVGGAETVTLLQTNLPMHTHPLTGTATVNTQIQLAVPATSAVGTPTATNSFLGAAPAAGPGEASIYSSAQGANPVTMSGVTTTLGGTTGAAGGSLPVSIESPYLAVNFSIALQGIFPSRG